MSLWLSDTLGRYTQLSVMPVNILFHLNHDSQVIDS